MKLGISNALRPSELFPLRWRCFREETHTLDIQETVYEGKIRPYGKTKGSLTHVPIADILAGEIVEYREECRKDGKRRFSGRLYVSGPLRGTDGFEQLSASRPAQTAQRAGRPEAELPRNPSNYRHSRQDQGTPQGYQPLMRHSRLATTMEIYMQSLEKEVRTAIN
jgi:integrase